MVRSGVGRLLWWFLDGADGGDDALTHRLFRRRPRNAVEKLDSAARIAWWEATLRTTSHAEPDRQQF